ncbi:hypothetical protein LF599_06805 [Pseudodesulfovibrio thermohalotolerans]|uniref:hypothetical protein n=1 Tax=Pseudodesulfovibrio thermohalotolerans TaxID=2880651 RepID=UPI002441E8AF|nr:hypothetical protein [Pseudodesulfovibrio thermohalotolerans]WFS63865.1 hypothetical protein LF599_06805 [Pseudodesulfovibrio thermohalotolerans]
MDNEMTRKSRRPGSLENGEINKNDAFQQEILCSWPELFSVPDALASEINLRAGFLAISTPGMTTNEFGHAVNALKGHGLIPGGIRPQNLIWDGQNIVDLMKKLRVLQSFGTVHFHDLPGYDIGHPAVLTTDASCQCLLDDTIHGRHISKYTGRVASIDAIEYYEALSKKCLRSPIVTPATVYRAGFEVTGQESIPDLTEVRKLIPEDGHATIKIRCIYCGTAVKVRGYMRDREPHYEVDTTPRCPHLRLLVGQFRLDGHGSKFHDFLVVRHVREPDHKPTKSQQADD